MKIVQTRDADLVKRIITDPRIYPWVTEDDAPPVERFDCAGVVDAPGVYFLSPLDGADVAGVFMVHRHTSSIYEVHTCILPKYWGRSIEAARALIAWVFDNTGCRKLITLVPENNRHALALAKNAGMQEQGCITQSYLKGGKMLDQIILGIGRRQLCQ